MSLMLLRDAAVLCDASNGVTSLSRASVMFVKLGLAQCAVGHPNDLQAYT
jgi:hypothetical protein